MVEVSEDSVAGERTGVEAWLLDAYPAIRRFAAVVGPTEIGPDDLVHDAIVKMMQAGGFDRLRDPMAYLKRAVVNLAANERRRLGASRRRDHRVRHESPSSYSDVYPSSIDPMLSLSPKARAVVYLHYIEGESFEDIALTLNLRASSVRQTATRARRQLARLEGMDQ